MAKIRQFFFKGLSKDTDALLQPENTVTDLWNMQIISNADNSYSIESAKGDIVSFNLNPCFQPLGFAALSDKLIIASTKSLNATADIGEIGIVTFAFPGNLGTYVPLYSHLELNFSAQHQIEARAYSENPSIERVYWTDFFNTPKALNIANPVLTTQILVGSLVIGEKYMVLKGTVTQPLNPNVYGPCETLGTVFTADGTEVYSIGNKVIEYYDINNLEVNPKSKIGTIQFNRYLAGGSVLTGMYQYAYRLKTSDGAYSPWSYVTRPVHMSGPFFPGSSAQTYQEYQGDASTAAVTNSTKQIEILVDGIDISYSNIQVAYVRSIDLNSSLPPIIFFDSPITGAAMLIPHTGADDLEAITFADLELLLPGIRKAKTLEIFRNRLFYGNIEQGLKFEFDPSTATVEPIEYMVPSDIMDRTTAMSGGTGTSSDRINGHGYAIGAGIASGQIYPCGKYKVTIRNVIYNGTEYGPNAPAITDVFDGVSGFPGYAVGTGIGVPIVKAIIRIQKYTGVYNDIILEDDWYDTKGMAVDTYLRSLWRAETYRRGVMMWDIFGNPTHVRWMADILIPEQYQTSGGIDFKLGEVHTWNSTNDTFCFKHIGLKVSGLDLKQIADDLGIAVADLNQYFSGFSVVGAPRDATILGQGLMWATVNPNDGNNIIHPQSTVDLQNDHYYAFPATGSRQVNLYMWHSPDFQLNFNNLPNESEIDSVKIVDYYDDAQAFSVSGTIETNTSHYYQKFLDQAVPTGAGSPKGTSGLINPDYTWELDIGVTGQGVFAPLGISFDNTALTAGFAPQAARNMIGARGMMINTVAAEGAGNLVNGLGEFTAGATIKPLVNWIRPKSNLYGGSSANAKANTKYQYLGHFQALDTAFMAYLVGNVGIVDDIEVFGGDCYLTLWDNARLVADLTQPDPDTSYAQVFPCESNVNTFLRQGRHISRDGSADIALGINITNGIQYPLAVESYVYNEAYSTDEPNIFYDALPVDFVEENIFKHRVIYSELKTDGEVIDNFRIFLPNSFRDVDGSNGEINNIKDKEGRLFYWQNHSVGYLPVNERVTTGSALGDPVTLGIGGVLDRFDELKNYYGNQHQWSLIETEDGFAWFDLRRRAFMFMSVGAQIIELSAAKGLISFFSNVFVNTAIQNDNPIYLGGIHSVYDARFKRILMCFRKGTTYEQLQSALGNAPSGIVKGSETASFSIAFDTKDKQFGGFFNIDTGIMVEFGHHVYSAWQGIKSGILPLQAYELQDVVGESTGVYVCILAYTTIAIPVVPSADPTHWALASQAKQVYVHNAGKIAHWKGIGYDEVLETILNPDKETAKISDNMQWVQNENFWTTIIYINDTQTATDVDIVTATNKEYSYRDRNWLGTIPLDDTAGARMVDNYIRIRHIKNNWVAENPTTSRDELLKIVSLISDYRKAY